MVFNTVHVPLVICMQELRLGCSIILLDDGHHDYTVLLELFAGCEYAN